MESQELITIEEEPIVRVALLYNAFDPSQTIREELLYVEGKNLAEYVEGLPDTCEWRIGHNAIPIEPENFSEIIPLPEDIISVVAIPRGGSGKDILRMVAQLAIVVGAIFVGFAIGGPWGAIAAAAITMVGMFLVNWLIPPAGAKKNKDDAATYGYDGAKNTSREGVAIPVVYGQFRTAGNYVDVYTENVGNDQYLYGRTVLSDGEIDSVVGEPELNEQTITDYHNIQWGYTHGTLSEPINTNFGYSKAQFFRSDKLTTTYADYTTSEDVDAFELDLVLPNGLVDYKIKDGTKGNFSVSVEIQYAPYGTSDWTNPGTTGGATSHSTFFTGSSPIGTSFVIDAQGVDPTGTINGTATYNLQYSPAGMGTWTTYQTFNDMSTSFTSTGSDTTAISPELGWFEARLFNQYNQTTQYPIRAVQVTLPSGSYDFRITGDGIIRDMYAGTIAVGAGTGGASASTTITYTDKRTVTIRKTYKSPTLPRGRYHIRYRRTNVDDVETHPDHISEIHAIGVNEIQHSQVSLGSVATGWYIAKMTDQLSSIPTITWLVKGVKVDIYDVNGEVTANQWSDNPADIVLDMMIGELRGPLRGRLNVDWPAFVQWRQHCEDEGLKFNGVYDDTITLWDALTFVFRCGRAMPVRIGSKLSVAVDKAQQPAMLFTPGNIYKNSFQISYLPMVDRANEFEVSYYDRDDRNKRKTIRVADPDAAQEGQVPKTVSYDLFGIDNFEQAQKDIWYQLYNNRLQRRFITFDAPVESIGLTIGDVALIQHDMVDWGTAGRTATGSTSSTIKLDRPVTIEAATTYSLLVIHSTLQKATCSISLIDGNTYALSGLSSTSNTEDTLKRIRTNTGDEAAIEVFDYTTGSNAIITLDRTVTGTTAALWDVDVIEERTVTTGASTTDTIAVSSAFSQAPTIYSNFMFGENTIVKRPFRLRSISGDAIEKKTLTFTEYNEFVYSDPEQVIPAPTSKPPTFPTHVTGLTLSLDPVRVGTTVEGTLSWQVGDILRYAGVDVYIATNGGNFVFYNTVMNTTTMLVHFQHGNEVTIKVVAFNDHGLRANFNDAPTITKEINSSASGLADPTDLTWTLDGVALKAFGKLSWIFASPSLGNISPITRVQLKFEGESDWLDKGTTNQEILEITDIPAGTHDARIRSENTTGAASDWVTISFDVNTPVLVAPTFLTDGSAVDHDLNTDSSCNLNVEWQWAGTESDIDGFQIVSYQGATNTPYVIGTTPTAETFSTVTADKRIFWFYGVPCDKWYTLYLRAFKYVDSSFDASGIIYSTANKPSLAGEDPYQPDSNVAFGGDVIGTIGGVPVDDIIASLGDVVAPDVPTGLTLSSSIETNPDGTEWIKLLAEWNPNTEMDLAGYVIALKEDASDFIEFNVGDGVTAFYWSVLANTDYTAKVKSFDFSQNYSAYTSDVSHTTIADITPPAAPTSLTGTAAITSIFLSWTNPVDTDIVSIKIYENSVDDSSTATNIATVLATPSSQGRFTRSGLTTGTTKYYWVKAVDRSDNSSSFSIGTNVTTAQVGTGDIAANSITAALIAAGTITADEILAGSITGDKFDTGTSLPGTITVGLTGVSIGTVESYASDPANRINSYTTQILPGLIEISGSTTLSDWRQGGDLTKIAGGRVSANTISANKLYIGLRGVDIAGLEFSANSPTADHVYWSSGSITFMDDTDTPTVVSITADDELWTTGVMYVYWVKGSTTLNATTNVATAYNPSNIVLATYSGGTDLVANYGRTIIDGSHIITGTIDANRIKASTVIADTVIIGSGGPTTADIAGWAESTDSTYIDGGQIFTNSITATQITTGTLITTSAQLGNATVTTLTIAGQSIVIPSVTEGSDTTLISSTATDLVTSPTITVGDATDGKALITIFGYMDFTLQVDAGAAIDLYASEDGGAYSLKKTVKVGVTTTGGSTKSYIPFNASFTIDGISTIAIKMKGRQINMPDLHTSVVRDPTIVIQGAAR